MSLPSSARTLKFVNSDPNRGGLPVKRKQVSQACDACRKRKRRCIHGDGEEEEDRSPKRRSSSQAASLTSPSLPAVVNTVPETTVEPGDGCGGSASHARSASEEPSRGSSAAEVTQRARTSASTSSKDVAKPQTRFVGDLNPEAMFQEAAIPTSAQDTAQKYDVGIWFTLGSGAASQQRSQSQFITSRPPQAMDQYLLPFVKEQCLTALPPDEEFAQMKRVFYNKIHPMFPIIPYANITQGDTDDPAQIVLRQLICLAASTDPESSRALRLCNKGPDLLTPQEFSQTVSSALRATLETSLIPDRVLHIRALTILSMYAQPTCAEEADLPAQLGGRAIHHIQTLGLHLLRYDAPNVSELESLFCAVWALDRLNAAQYGRACLIHERDIGTNLQHCIDKQAPCFRLLLSVVQWLDHVIELYRPGATAASAGSNVAYIDLPVMEAMIVDAQALKVPSFLIATIEALYHAVVILSCRLHRPGTAHSASTLPPPSSNARRSLAADRIACAIPRDHLCPTPFVSYAVSLALSVEYRKMRHSRLPMFRARAMNAFRRNCAMLRGFGDYFWSARVVGGLGERVMAEMEKAARGLREEASPPTPANAELSSVAPASAAPPPIHLVADDDSVAPPEPDHTRNKKPTDSLKPPDGSNPTGGDTQRVNFRPAVPNSTPTANNTPPPPPPPQQQQQQQSSRFIHPLNLTTTNTANGLDNMVDFSMIDAISGQDIFGHIDPSFNLDAVEQAFDANLDLGLPLNWGDWGDFAT